MSEEKEIPTGKIFIISGPSGVGKDYTVELMTHLEGYDKLNLGHPRSYTTRRRRKSDPEECPYIFVSASKFADLIAEDMVEVTEIHGHMYGTSKTEFEQTLAAGKNIIKILDKDGAKAVKSLYPRNATIIYLRPPSIATLVRRLKGRDSETPEEYSRRMADNIQELRDLSGFDYVLTAGSNAAGTARILLTIIQEALVAASGEDD